MITYSCPRVRAVADDLVYEVSRMNRDESKSKKGRLNDPPAKSSDMVHNRMTTYVTVY